MPRRASKKEQSERRVEENPRASLTWEEDDREEFGEGEDGDEDEAASETTHGKRRRSSRRTRADWDVKIERLVRGKSQAELADLVLSLVDRYPELRQEFRERIALSEGDVKQLVGQARRELHQVTSESAWRNSWTGEGNPTTARCGTVSSAWRNWAMPTRSWTWGASWSAARSGRSRSPTTKAKRGWQ